MSAYRLATRLNVVFRRLKFCGAGGMMLELNVQFIGRQNGFEI
jgi:hypothetical protein